MKLSIRLTTIGGLAGIALFGLTAAGIGLWGQSVLDASVDSLNSNTVPSLQVVHDLVASTANARQALGEALLSSDPTARERSVAEMTKLLDEVETGIKGYEPLISDEKDQAHFDAAHADFESWRSSVTPVVELAQSGQQAQAIAAYWDKQNDLGDTLEVDMDALFSYNVDLAAAERESSNRSSSLSFTLTIAAIAAFLLACGAVLVLVMRRVLSPLSYMTTAMQEIAQDKLDTEVPGISRKDEIGDMAGAVEVFRQNGLRVRDLTETERREAAVRAARVEMMQQLQRGLGTVVDASIAGDFSQRVTAEFDDAELNGLANGVNQLVETVDRGLTETEHVLSALAQTDLRPRMTGDYEGAFARLKDDVNAVAETLTGIVGRLRTTSSGLKMATGEILAGANDLSERTTKQAATIEETSAAMEQLSTTVKANAQNAESASQRAAVASEAAEAGGVVMRNATSAMERISSSSSKISNIIGMIDDIAFQTNLLALNASVEAARAGEAGKGFAVVAVEVRRLAQSAATASSDVKSLIELSSAEVATGSRLVDDAASKLAEMLMLVRESAQSMQSIARASGEQAGSIVEINTAVRQMDEMTQHNAALVEETNAAIEQTETQASELDRIVSQFRLATSEATASVTPLRKTAKPAAPKARRLVSEGNAAVSADWSEF